MSPRHRSVTPTSLSSRATTAFWAIAVISIPAFTNVFSDRAAAANSKPSEHVIFDFDGHRIVLEREHAGISHFNRKDATTTVWTVEPPYERPVSYVVANLPKSNTGSRCDRLQMGIFARRQVPLPLGDPAWMELETEPTGHPGILRLTETLTGRPDEPGGFRDTFKLEDEKLRASSGNFPLLGCSPAACNVMFEIEAPLFAQINYPPKLCAIENVIPAIQSIMKELQGRLVR